MPRSASSTLESGARKNPQRPFAVTITPDAKPVLSGNHFWAVDIMVVYIMPCPNPCMIPYVRYSITGDCRMEKADSRIPAANIPPPTATTILGFDLS